MQPKEKSNHQSLPTMNRVSYNKSLPITHANWYNTGTNAVGVTNHFFLSWVEGLLHRMKPIPDTVNEAENLRLDRLWTIGEKTTMITFLNELSNKMIPKNIAISKDQHTTQLSSEKLLTVDDN